jgi:hypothetical protein
MMDGQYDISNSTGITKGRDVLPVEEEGEKELFQGFDIPLALGPNLITVHGEIAGNQVSTNVEVIFTTVGHTNPPIITPRWPTDGMEISSPTFTARGSVDDYTATLKGIMVGGGRTNEVEGMVERNGMFWVEAIPLLAATNVLTFVATDVAGNTARTNLTLIKSELELVIETTPTGTNLYQSYGLVTGRVSPGYEVYVNGTKAVVEPNGHWRAEKTPIYGMGTATFDVSAVQIETGPSAKKPAPALKSLLSSKASLGPETIVLNPNQPACGGFALHLTGTGGKNFMLMSSTNMTDWLPILTNYNSPASFDYLDTNAAGYSCRFFRVIPLP